MRFRIHRLSAGYQAEVGGILWVPAIKFWLQKPATLTESLRCCSVWCGVDYPPASRVKVKERIKLYIYSPSGLDGLL